jgi:pimeloyl-ACP methyl ester carboxylesterase
MSGSDPLVLVPGLGSDGTVWERTVAALGPEFDCRIADTLSDDSLSDMADRLLADAPERFALAGLSMGGMVALEVMRRSRGRVTRLALFDTTPLPDDSAALRQREALRDRLAAIDTYVELPTAMWSYMVHPSAVADVAEDMERMTRAVGPARYRRQVDAVIARDDLLPVLAVVDCPTIVVVGRDDVMTPPAVAQFIAHGIAGAELIVIPDCGHLPPFERPAQSAAIIRQWMA